MNTTKSATLYIEDNDFEGAIYRFYNTNSRWRRYWFEVCYEIATNDKKWFLLYTFYPSELKILAAEPTEDIFPNQRGNLVYLIKMFDKNNEYVFLKGGKTIHLKQRMKKLSDYTYKRENVQISRVEIIKTWELPREHLAESFEQTLHDYFCKKKLQHFPKDRFTPILVTEEDFIELNRRYEVICSLA